MLHVLGEDERRRAVAALATVLGDRGTLVLLETNWQGDALGYLEHLGGRDGRLPPAVDRLVRFGVPRPSSIGPEQLAALFPGAPMDRHRERPGHISAVRTSGADGGPTIPGFHAVLRRSAG